MLYLISWLSSLQVPGLLTNFPPLILLYFTGFLSLLLFCPNDLERTGRFGGVSSKSALEVVHSHDHLLIPISFESRNKINVDENIHTFCFEVIISVLV